MDGHNAALAANIREIIRGTVDEIWEMLGAGEAGLAIYVSTST